MNALARTLRAEVRKLVTIRSTFIILAVGFVISIAFGALVAFAPRHGRRSFGGTPILPPHGSAKWFLDSLAIFGQFALPLALIIGVMMVTGEYRHKTVTSTFLAEPRRTIVVAGKLTISAFAGFAVGITSAAGALVLGFILVASSHGTVSLMLTQYKSVLGYVGAAALYAVYGAGLGALLKSQIATLIVGLGADLVVIPVISGTLPSVARWLPGEAAQALASGVQRSGFENTNVNLLPWWGGVLILLAWGVVLAGVGAAMSIRRDVT
ncbi:MAG: hypothetical protein WAM97_07035 [Acidimicrobiales bacterium]|jgi:ABC-2 type transport system permease protein